MMTMNHDLKTAMHDALRIFESASALGQQLAGGDLHRATVARRLSNTHETAVRQAKELADAAAHLVTTLQCDGIGARLDGRAYARLARKVSGSLIRLTECRDIFEALHAQQEVAGLLQAGNLEHADRAEEEEQNEETED